MTEAIASAPPRSLDFLDPRLKLLCETYLRAAQVPGASIAIVADGRAYHHAHGVKSIRSGDPVTPNTAFNIGSCTKAFVSATLASMVADQLVAWDDPISRFVPEFQLYDAAVTQQVTLRDLSANRLGLPRAGLTEFGFDTTQSPEAALAGLRHTAPLCGLRERFTYVNLGHVANALAIGRISGRGFLTTLRERVLAPLGMQHTSGGLAARELADQAAWHCVADGKLHAIDTVYTDWYLGGGGLSVSGADALQWLRLHLNGGVVDGRQVIARTALLETHTPHIVARPGRDIVSLFHPGAHMAAYALGWAVADLDGHPLVLHSGGDFGISAMTMLLPRDGIGIAVYTNCAGRGTIGLPYALASCLLGLKPRDWKASFDAALAALAPATPADAADAPARPADLAGYAGVYDHPADGALEIEASGGVLTGRFRSAYRLSFRARPVGGHRFAIECDHPEWRTLMGTDPWRLGFDAATPARRAEWTTGPWTRAFERRDREPLTL